MVYFIVVHCQVCYLNSGLFLRTRKVKLMACKINDSGKSYVRLTWGLEEDRETEPGHILMFVIVLYSLIL